MSTLSTIETGSFRKLRGQSGRSFRRVGNGTFAPKCNHYKRRLAPPISGHCISKVDTADLLDDPERSLFLINRRKWTLVFC